VGLAQHAEDVGLLEDEVFHAVQFHFSATVFADEHAVTFLHVELDDFAVVVTATSAEGNNFSLLWLLFSGVWEENAASGFFFAFDTLHEDAGTEWFDGFSHVCYLC
jgi:hypothetical protein